MSAPIYRKIEVKLWRDPRFLALSPPAKLVLLHLLTGPGTTQCGGIFLGGVSEVSVSFSRGFQTIPEPSRNHSRWYRDSFEMVASAFAELEDAGEIITDTRISITWVEYGFTMNTPQNPNNVRSWPAVFTEIPECSIKRIAWEKWESWTKERGGNFYEGFQTIPEPSRNHLDTIRQPSRNQDQDQDQQQDKKKDQKQQVYRLPSGRSDPALLQSPTAHSEDQGQNGLREDSPKLGSLGPGTKTGSTRDSTLIDAPRPAGLVRSPKKAPTRRERWKPMVQEVVNHWLTYHPRATAVRKLKSTSNEYRKVVERLEEGFTVEQLQQAIDGCEATPHNRGDTEKGTKYLGLHIVCASFSNVTRFIETANSAPRVPKRLDLAAKNEESLQNWRGVRAKKKEQGNAGR